VVLPAKRLIEIYRQEGEDEILTAVDTLTFPDLLPGFSVAVGKLFPPITPNDPSAA